MLALIGFDTASVPVLERLLDEGRLPALQALRERGEWRTLRRPPMDVEAGAYQTLYSGMPLSEHGLYFPFQWSATDQRLRYIHAFAAPEAVWVRVARAGGRSLVVDPYEARIPRVTAGVHLSGWQFANRFVLPRWSSPRPVRRELERRFGRPPLVEEVFGQPSTSGLLDLRRRLLEAPDRAAQAITELLSWERFDLLWINLPASHVAGHRLWDVSQLGLGADDLGDPVPEVYAAVDRAISKIVAALPADADVVVFSPSGMGPNTSRVDLLPKMLELVLAGENGRRKASDSSAGGSIWRLRAALPASLRGQLARALPSPVLFELSARLELRADWSRTKAFPLPSDGTGYVRLNLRGREREGIVDPGEADSLATEIADGLSTFRDPDGSPAVAGVERVSELVDRGPGSERLPDLVVRWSDRPSAALSGVSSPRFGEVPRHGGGTGRTGHHTADAWALLVPAGSAVRETSRPPHIVDIPATACSLLGADSAGLAGEPLLERT
jgi:predicted AlkP superfamily phosphohydrolase/phosphomutase